jgi:hypothetical protein
MRTQWIVLSFAALLLSACASKNSTEYMHTASPLSDVRNATGSDAEPAKAPWAISTDDPDYVPPRPARDRE